MFQQEFTDRVVLLTGGSGQIGHAIANAYAQAGAYLIIVDPSRPELEHLDAQTKGEPGVYYLKSDITDSAQVARAVETIYAAFGAIDVLINCAGISVFTPFEERTEAEFDQVMDVNVKGMFLITQRIARIWKETKQKGVILNFGSIYGVAAADQRIYGDSGRNSPEVYAISKAGVIHFTRYLARYLGAEGIRVNCISPGGIFAGQKEFFVQNYEYKTPLGRMGDPEDLLGAVFFLTSSLSAYVTGVNLLVDGGFAIGN